MSRYPHTAGFKGTLETGREGAEYVTPKLKTRHAEVLADLALHGPSTAEQIAARTDRHWYLTRPRISELKAQGLVIETGERRPTEMGGRTHVVRLTTAEERALHYARLAAEREKAA